MGKSSKLLGNDDSMNDNNMGKKKLKIKGIIVPIVVVFSGRGGSVSCLKLSVWFEDDSAPNDLIKPLYCYF